MENYFARRGVAYRNECVRACAELTGIAEGLVADAQLNDAEIGFLNRWLEKNDAASCDWPGDVLHARVREVLADGVVTEDERTYLLKTLHMLVGGHLERLAELPKVNELALDHVERVEIAGSLFCLTGDFVFAPREQCEEAVVSRGGRVCPSVTKKINYLVIGGLGSDEWKHGNYGTKILKAIEYKRQGCPILLIHEDSWTRAL
ncbi:MAG: BRCT domain-containing protein [Burkholderiales bacterium]